MKIEFTLAQEQPEGYETTFYYFKEYLDSECVFEGQRFETEQDAYFDCIAYQASEGLLGLDLPVKQEFTWE